MAVDTQEATQAVEEETREPEAVEASDSGGAEPETEEVSSEEPGSPGDSGEPHEGDTAPEAECAAENDGASETEDVAGSAGDPGEPRAPGAEEADATEDSPKVRRAEFQALSCENVEALGDNLQLLMDVTVPVTVELGATFMRLRDILGVGAGSVVRLDRPLGEPVDVLVNGERVGRGEVVVVDDQFGVQITELENPDAERKRR